MRKDVGDSEVLKHQAICLAKVRVVVLLKGERRGIDIWRQFVVSAILPHLALSTILYYSFL